MGLVLTARATTVRRCRGACGGSVGVCWITDVIAGSPDGRMAVSGMDDNGSPIPGVDGRVERWCGVCVVGLEVTWGMAAGVRAAGCSSLDAVRAECLAGAGCSCRPGGSAT